MKHAILIAAITAPFALHAEDIAKPSSLSVRAKEVASKRKDTTHWRTSYGSHDTTTSRSRVIEAEVTNFGGKPAPGAKVDIYWIAKGSSRLYVLGKETEDLNLEGIRKVVEFQSPEISERNTRFATLNEHWKEGDRLAGYVLMLSYQDYEYPVVSSAGASSIRSKRDLDALLVKGSK